MNLSAWLVSIIPSLAGRVMLALGFSAVTFTGWTFAIGSIKELITNNLASGTPAIVQLMGLAGVGTGVGIIFGAVAFRLAYYQLASATKIVIK